ncbi:MAG: glycosyltransferase family 39 protein [Solirubrobacterales bacterium]|nr:glycosyltransferase family 39 protein [Solirubrobacterales bacterium]
MLLVTVLGAALRLVAFDRVRVNPYYDAAVRSMGQSWHNFFYGAFDPAGQVSIDKTPADLWLQVASTKLLGFTPITLRLPEVIAGMLAIPLLYDLVRRLFGHRAGVLAAAALAVLPISVVTARSDTMDSLMTLLMLGAAWLIVRAALTHRTWPLLSAGALMGLAFNVKLFEALIAVPALLVLAVLVADDPWRRRVTGLAGAAVVFAGVSLSWLIAVSLLPTAHRPYPIGSTNGSVWNVVFVFNGIDRVRTPPSAAQALLDPPGITRLFTTTGVLHGRLIGSMLIAALALGAAAVATLGWHRLRGNAQEPQTGDELRRRRAGTAFLAVWLILGFGLFSAMGRLHPRYLEAFTPAVAGTIGVSLAWLTMRARRDPVARWLLVVAVVATAVLAPAVAVPGWPTAGVIALIAAAVAVLVAAGLPRVRASGAVVLLAAATVAVLAVPTATSVHLARAGASSSGRPGYAPPARVAALSRYLKAHQGSARYETASTSVAKAGPLIVHDGRPVLMLTSLYDRPLLTPAQLAGKVATGEVNTIMLGRGTCTGRAAATCAPVVRWARNHGTDVSRAAGQRPGTLYHLTTKAVR